MGLRDFLITALFFISVIGNNIPQQPRGVVVITTAQLHKTKSELKLCAGSNPARGVLEIRDGEDF